MGGVRTHELGDAEIRDFDFLAAEDDHIRRLDVAMNDTLGVRVVDRGCDLRHQTNDDLGTESFAFE